MLNLRKTFIPIFSLFFLLFSTSFAGQIKNEKKSADNSQVLDLKQCINLALQNNHQAKISDQSLRIAEAQYKQVISSYWPQISASANYIRLDESPIFVYPEETSEYVVNGLLLPGLPPGTPVNMTVTVPEKRTKLMDRTNGTLSLDFMLPLYLGGRRSALRKQAKGQINVRQQEKRKSDLQIIYDVKERYYGNVLAKKLYKLGQETVDRVDVTLELTENMYKNGSGKVSKTDFLKNKMFSSSIHALQTTLSYNLELSASALAFTIAEKEAAPFETKETELPYSPIQTELPINLKKTFSNNPDWLKVQEAAKIYDAKVDEAKSEFWFKAALIGKINHIKNKYKYGAVSTHDKDSWMIGAGVELPLFSGFSSRYKVQEMRARASELEEKQYFLKDGLALQIKSALLKIKSLQDKVVFSKDAMKAAIDNRELTERAYSIEMASAQDMIQSQLFESLAIAQYYKALYDHLMAKANLDLLTGIETGI